MPVRSDFEPAASISIAGCDTCSCGSIVVRLHDASGAIFAAASIGSTIADAFLAQVEQHVRQQREGGLGAIRCEGTA